MVCRLSAATALAPQTLRPVQQIHRPMLPLSLSLPSQDGSHWLAALAINALLIAVAQRAPLLTPVGWVHAGILGTVLWGSLGWPGWLAVVAYLALGSAVTKLGFKAKQASGLAEGRGGRRGPENVWGSALVAAVLAMLTPWAGTGATRTGCSEGGRSGAAGAGPAAAASRDSAAHVGPV